LTWDDTKWRKLATSLKHAKTTKAKVGALQGAGDHGDGLSMAELLAINEYGSERAGVPERAPLRTTFNDPEFQREFNDFIAKQAELVLAGRANWKTAFKRVGVWAEAKVKARIAAGLTPENAPATIEKKKSSKPLIDTGRLVPSITSDVE
jgi:hypothetical protein